jgi:hypothetical protein
MVQEESGSKLTIELWMSTLGTEAWSIRSLLRAHVSTAALVTPSTATKSEPLITVIEAKVGQTFTIRYNFPSVISKPFPTEIRLYIDGKLIDTDVSGCDSVRANVKGEFLGYSIEDGIHKSTYKAFSFASPKLTGE